MHGTIAWTLLLSMIVAVVPSPTSVADATPLTPGDYGVYQFGVCFPNDPLYPPFFAIEQEYIRAWGVPCPVFLRWDVLSVEGGVARVNLSMEGWQANVRSVIGILPNPDRKEMETLVTNRLNSAHIVEVDMDTMDVTLTNGTYVGRWDFLLTPTEVASGRTKIARNWFGGTVFEGNVTITDDLMMESEVYLQETYGISTFAMMETDCGVPPWNSACPLPPGLEKYLPESSTGWDWLPFRGTAYDASTLLMLYSMGMEYYSDPFFRLYGIIWQANSEKIRTGVIPTAFMRLIDTNIITLPGAEPGDGGGTEPGDGGQPEDGVPIARTVPWEAIILLPAAAGAASVLAYLHLRPRRWKEGGEEVRPAREEGSH